MCDYWSIQFLAFQMNTLQNVSAVHTYGESGKDTFHSDFWIKLSRLTRIPFWENLEAWVFLWVFFCAHQAQGIMWKCLLIVICVEKKFMAGPELFKSAFQFWKVVYRPQQRSCLLKLILLVFFVYLIRLICGQWPIKTPLDFAVFFPKSVIYSHFPERRGLFAWLCSKS